MEKAASTDNRPKLTLHEPAKNWIEGLPLGNGISAAMLWGMPFRTILSLNHVDFWRHDLNLDELPDLSGRMAEVRRLMMAGKAKEANELFFGPKVYGQLHNMPRQRRPQVCGYTNAFEPVGDIVVELENQKQEDATAELRRFTGSPQPSMTNYVRALDLEKGVASVAYRIGDNDVRYECFVPARADVVILTISASRPISGRVFFTRLEQPEFKWSATGKQNELRVDEMFDEGVRAAMTAVLQVSDGHQGTVASNSSGYELCPRCGEAQKRNSSDALTFADVTECRLLIAVDSGRGAHDPRSMVEKKIAAALRKKSRSLLNAHLLEHASMFNRVELSLGGKTPGDHMDARQLLEGAERGDYADGLAELTFQFGRYLMMSCNRAGRRPANLQGIWNRDIYPVLESDWHFDMNVQMNQWLCNPTNLDECNLPLFTQMEYFVPQGRMVAKRMLGCEGVLFNVVAGGDGINWFAESGLWCGAAGWLAQHFWEHYEFTLDREFLAVHAYPFMKEVGLFFKSWLVKDRGGHYVTGFSYSPENMPPNGFGNNVHCTMDTAIVREITANLLAAGRTLGVDQELWPAWRDLHDNVLPYPVSDKGELKEWPHPLEEQPTHRHFSHLYPLFPGKEFTKEGAPKLFAAARKALRLRETTGRRGLIFWSYPYLACFHARMGEGDKALKNLCELAGKCSEKNLLPYHNYHYRLFQVEALFGATAAIAEMLAQSHEGFIRLLPALPKRWASGRYRGLKARGAFEVDCSWKDGKVAEAAIKSLKGTPCKVRNSRPWKSVKVSCAGKKVPHELDAKTKTISFATQPGDIFKLRFE